MNKLYTTLLAGSLLASLASAGQAATFAFSFSETDGHPNAFTYSLVSGTDYALLGATTDGTISFSGAYAGSPANGVNYAATITVSATESLGDIPATKSEEFLDSLKITFTGASGGPFAGMTLLQITAGSPTGHAGILQAQDGTGSGGFSGSNATPPGTSQPNNVAFTSSVISTTGWNYESYAAGLDLPPGDLFSYTPRPFPSSVSDLNPFIAQIVVNGSANTPVTTPEPGSRALAVGALVSVSALRRRRK
jgi:hypothetical protein